MVPAALILYRFSRLSSPPGLTSMSHKTGLLIALILWLASPPLVLSQSEEGQRFPAFELLRSDGTTFSSEAFAGKVTIVNFWATWCAPCRVEVPWFTEFKQEYGAQGFEIVGVTLDGDNAEAVDGFIRDLEINYPILTADEAILEAIGGIIGVPTTFILDRDGNVALKHIGLANRKQLVEKIEALVR